MIKLVNILESITEKQVTKGDWDKADGEQRVDWLLQIFDDADKAEKHFETEWEDLPNEARDFMKISESVNEGKDNRSHIILRVEPRNYDAMVDKLQDMNINHNQESKNTIKVYTDKTSGWYGNSKAQYKLTHDVWVDKFVIRESIVNEGFEIGDIVKFSYTGINKSPKSRMEIIDSRKMFASDLIAYIVKKEDGSTAEYDQTQLTAAPTMWRPNKSDLNEGSSPGYSKFIFSLQTLIGDIAPNAWEDKSQIDSTSMKRIHNSLKKRYGDDYAKFNDLLKTQKGQFGNWYLKESVNEGKWMDLWDESQDKAPSAWTKHQKWIVANAERYGFDPDKVKKLLKQHTAIHNRTYGMFASVEDWMEEKLKSRRTS
mgnify:FL=1